ncbi:hypothetical protein QNH14_10395 [Apirhabdus apintestini]|nr:hypothetical protein QNH14_10395 [Enterobacteriaceae bacterium CA-0114]
MSSKQAVQCEGLFRQIQLAITRLENLPLMETHGAAVVLPPEAVVASPSGQDTPAAQQPEPVVSARPHSVGEGGERSHGFMLSSASRLRRPHRRNLYS